MGVEDDTCYVNITGSSPAGLGMVNRILRVTMSESYMDRVHSEAETLAYALQIRADAETRIASMESGQVALPEGYAPGQERECVGKELLTSGSDLFDSAELEPEQVDAIRVQAAYAAVGRELLGISLACAGWGGICTCRDRTSVDEDPDGP